MKKPEVAICFAMSPSGVYQPSSGEFHKSTEDARHFSRLLSEHDASIIGAETYRANAPIIKKYLTPRLLRTVLTHRPFEYSAAEVPDQLEFKDMSVRALISELIRREKEKILIVSGVPATEALEANLVNTIYLTLEPILIGQGRNLTGNFNIPMELKAGYPKPLNKNTLLLCYDVRK